MIAGWKAYDLAPFFYAPLDDVDAIEYRQEIARELERDDVMATILDFAGAMRAVREHLDQAQHLHYFARETQRWHLRAAELYCDAVEHVSRDLERLAPSSRGLRGLIAYLREYVAGPAFTALASAVRKAASDLAAVRYALWLRQGSATVRAYDGEPDYTVAVEETFAKFRRADAKDYLVKLTWTVGLCDLEARILDGIAELHPEPFAALAAFCAEHARFVDAAIARFDREIEFYVAYLARIAPLRRAGLPFCYPRMSSTSKAVSCKDAFDLALASKLHAERAEIVRNDFYLHGGERVFVVTGPNQGGKTTFARTFGQLQYLAALGLPVPGAEAHLFAFDHLFTHFERAEHVETLRSKLEDDLVRMHEILDAATSRSVLVINEAFASTTLEDAVALSKRVLARICEFDSLAVWVTFLDELAAFDPKVVSVVSTVDPRDVAVRTFHIERAPASGLAYAFAIAEKHGVTYTRLMERVHP
ncbi:MAG TPA: hypothetical protein VGG28_24190 [Kofleriaceae bacterium]